MNADNISISRNFLIGKYERFNEYRLITLLGARLFMQCGKEFQIRLFGVTILTRTEQATSLFCFVRNRK